MSNMQDFRVPPTQAFTLYRAMKDNGDFMLRRYRELLGIVQLKAAKAEGTSAAPPV